MAQAKAAHVKFPFSSFRIFSSKFGAFWLTIISNTLTILPFHTTIWFLAVAKPLNWKSIFSSLIKCCLKNAKWMMVGPSCTAASYIQENILSNIVWNLKFLLKNKLTPSRKSELIFCSLKINASVIMFAHNKFKLVPNYQNN